MDRVAVQSSNLVSVGYDLESFTLEVEFRSGAVYRYFSVPPEIHDGLMGTGAKGSTSVPADRLRRMKMPLHLMACPSCVYRIWVVSGMGTFTSAARRIAFPSPAPPIWRYTPREPCYSPRVACLRY
jgi:hypothetical protein